MIVYFSLSSLVLLFAVSLLGRTPSLGARSFAFLGDGEWRPRVARWFFIASCLGILLLLIRQSFLLYTFWSHDALGRLWLPPHNQTYFFKYIGFRFFAPYLVSFIISLGFLKLAAFYNKKYEERFFYPEERYWGALALFLGGHPGWLVYLIVLLTAYLVFQGVAQCFKRFRGERLPLYYFWLPAGIFAILVETWLSQFPWWQKLFI